VSEVNSRRRDTSGGYLHRLVERSRLRATFLSIDPVSAGGMELKPLIDGYWPALTLCASRTSASDSTMARSMLA
jgi:hypothetical protein